ncbi:LLM class flavin-dependent oxidoreductase [Streptomyces sp. NPDC048002]|uniref:LLM class flavin-dependent oxidoreductase n=1 Tax=Streptomyces sp. NPDC048002 TaxID=3154344 RepID=UPI0033F4369D
MIESWGFYIMTPEDYVSSAAELTRENQEEAFAHWLEILTRTEEWGFDGVTFAEHHFLPNSMVPSPHIAIAALIAKTDRLRFSTAGSVLSLHHGWRYAAEIAMLRYLSKGRFEPGIAPGSGSAEAVMAGFRAEDARPRYESGVELLQRALTGEHVTLHDEFHNVENLDIVPRWEPHTGQEPVWATVLSPESAAKTAERGWKLLTGWMPTEVAGTVAARYREAARACGHSDDPSMLGLRRRVFVAETDSEAQEKFEAAQDLMPMLMNRDGSQMELADPKIRAMVHNPEDFAIGSPETVAEKLIDQCQSGGFGTIFAWADFASFRWSDLARSHELFGTRVAPQLRAAHVDPAAADARVSAASQARTAAANDVRQNMYATTAANVRHKS